MTQPITFLLGAGASRSYGIPTMSGFYSEFRAHIRRRYPDSFQLLEELERRSEHSRPDLETLLSDLHAVIGMEDGMLLAGLASDQATEQILGARELRGYLDAFIVDRCERFSRAESARDLSILLKLRHVAPLWIFTTNYDRIVESACEHDNVRWADGFEVECPRPVANWIDVFDAEVRIVKLHGSVNWYQDDPGGELHRLDRGYSMPAHDFRFVRGQQQLRPLMIIPTLEKQALGAPYMGLAIRFADVLKETRLLVVAGNSLRDQHLREIIQQRLGRLRVLFVSPSASQQRGLPCDPERIHTLDSGFSEFLTIGGSALQRLASNLAGADDDQVIAETVDRFCSEVSSGLEDDAGVASSPELAQLWSELRADGTPRVVAAIRELADHSHPVVRRRLAHLMQEENDPHVRVAAVDSLVKLGGTETVEALKVAVLEDSSQEVRMEAALGLVRLDCADLSDWVQDARDCADVGPVLRMILEDLGARTEQVEP